MYNDAPLRKSYGAKGYPAKRCSPSAFGFLLGNEGRVFEISMSYDLKMLVREDEPRRGDLTDIGFCMPYFFL